MEDMIVDVISNTRVFIRKRGRKEGDGWDDVKIAIADG